MLIYLYSMGAERTFPAAISRTDGEGRYRFERLEPGPYMIRVFAPKANPFAHINTQLKRIERDEDGNVAIRPDVILAPGEVREFLEDCLGPDGLARSVVVAATSDAPALLRVRASAGASVLAPAAFA